MERNAVPRSLARDADGNAVMSLEEFKEGMFQSIRENGTVELIRAQLRRRFIEKLLQQRLNDDHDRENNAARAIRDAASSTPDEKLVHGLVAEYLAIKGLENTLAVFVPEIGGSRNQVDSATILEMLHVNSSVQNTLEMERANTGQSLLLVLVRELVRRFQLATMDSGTQTAMDCFDHRIVLENQLRRVENAYLAECASQKLEPQKSLEERMMQYQREYDEICERRLQEELERYKSTEVALVQAEERKRFDREVDNIRSSLLQENHNKQDHLQEREREMEIAFVARRTELETSLFETRQSLFKEMERLRVKEAELQVKMESDFRHFATETQRFQLWEESLRTQETNLESIVAQAMREKERAWNIERQQALQDIQTKQDELSDRERALTTETGTLKTLKTQIIALQQEVAALEAALLKSGDDVRTAQNSALQLEKDRQLFEERVRHLELQLDEQKNSLFDANTANARLTADKSATSEDLLRFKHKNAEVKEQMKAIASEVKLLQQEMLDMKLNEANAIVTERKKFMQILDEERERSQWKENELVTKVREMQSRLAESDARAEKYQSQYEDEKVHVESLRHDVSSLNSLLTQAQATINTKHGPPRDFRAQRGATSSDMLDTGTRVSPEYPTQGGNERTFMMKMMEMMANFHDGRSLQPDDSQRYRSNNTSELGRETNAIPARQDRVSQQVEASPIYQPHDEDQEEAQRLKDDQARIEQELVEQREYQKKKQARMQEEERELAEQNRQFDEKLARMRQERIEEEERIEQQRKRRQAEEESKLQEELARQRAAVLAASELQLKLTEQRLADERQRLQEEQSYKERRLAEEQKLNKEIEAKRRQQQLEDELSSKHKQEREAEEERLRQVRNAREEQERNRLEQEQAVALQAAKPKQEEEDRKRDDQIRQLEEQRKRKEAEDAELTRTEEGSLEASWHESSVEDDVESIEDDAESSHNEELSTTDAEVAVEGTTAVNNDDKDVSEDSSDNEQAPVEASVELVDKDQDVDDTVTEMSAAVPEPPAKTSEEEEQERQKTAEEEKKKEDENVIDIYRQRVLARKAAEKQRQMELEAENERKAKEEEERQRSQLLGDASESDHELELSGGSFAESSAASNSDSF